MTTTASDRAAWAKSLSDPIRSQLYDFVSSQGEPQARDAAAQAVGISRTLAAYHLDLLADAGLLAVSYARPDGRSGPGAGRPAKLYAPAHEEIAVTIPPRNYRLLADLLSSAAAADASGAVRSALAGAARAEGSTIGKHGADLLSSLIEVGYQPETVDDTTILRNCPFHQVAQHQTDLVCCMNQALVEGVLEGGGGDPARAELSPGTGRCCVVIHPD